MVTMWVTDGLVCVPDEGSGSHTGDVDRASDGGGAVQAYLWRWPAPRRGPVSSFRRTWCLCPPCSIRSLLPGNVEPYRWFSLENLRSLRILAWAERPVKRTVVCCTITSRVLLGGAAVTVGERIKQRREEKGLTAAELARRASISKGYLSEIEGSGGESGPRPSADVLFRIATVLGTSVADLLGREVRPTSKKIPASLEEFLKLRDLPAEDVEMLAGIKFRGAQPATVEDWAFLYESIRRSIRPAAGD